MPQTAIAADILEPRNVLGDLPPQLAFGRVVLVEEGGDPRQFVFMEVAGLAERIDTLIRRVCVKEQIIDFFPIEGCENPEDPDCFVLIFVLGEMGL